MARLAFIAFCICCCAPFTGVAQSVVYKSYGVKEGLAGTTVYCSLQDKLGFMWFGTDQGLSRFDGSSFKNFTTREGLTDNEVLALAEDAAGRLWMLCYNSKLCFMQQGIIHNPDNDSLLKQIEGEGQLFSSITTDQQGRVWIMGLNIHVVEHNRVKKFDTPADDIAVSVGYIGEQFSVITRRAIYSISEQNDKLDYKLYWKDAAQPLNENIAACYAEGACYITRWVQGKNGSVVKATADTVFAVALSSFGITDVLAGYAIYNRALPALLISAGTDGIKAFNSNLEKLPDPYPYLPQDVSFTHTTYDNEGNAWFTSLGKGVFLVPAQKILRYNLRGDFEDAGAFAVHGTRNGSIYVGFDYAHYAVLRDGELVQHDVPGDFSTRNRVVKICGINSNEIMLGTDYGTYFIHQDLPFTCQFMENSCVKDLAAEGDDSVLVGGSSVAYRIVKKTDSDFHLDTLWGSRTTAITKDTKGRIWLGNLSGLLVHENGKTTPFDKNAEINKSRITDLVCDAFGNVWVATHQRGLFVITGSDSIISINTGNGLPSDVCVRLFSESKDEMWVCTHRRAAKITFSNAPGFTFDVAAFGELSGETEALMHDMYIDRAHIWLATSKGLLQIEKTSRYALVAPPVYITAFQFSDSLAASFSALELQHSDNNIQIDYIGISYSSGGKITYKYLLNSTTDTVYTGNTSLNLSSLAPGKYSFKVWAKNNTGIWSAEPATLAFKILPPYWRTWWFITALLVAAALTVWMAVKWRIRQVTLREQEKTDLNKKIAEVELQAVRAQMNEHFIFNSLNSIQNFINQNNAEAANFYLANFGKLIRRTLDLSSMPAISLQEEIEYLDNYLTLEKMRFSENFDYSITNRITSVAPEHIIFPSMILQPYVENAIKHGLRHKAEGNGLLEISFIQDNEFIVCCIADNGIGRAKAAELKSKLAIHHQSKGIKLSEDRVYLFNRVSNTKIIIDIEDRMERGAAAGTTVKIFVPFKTTL